MKEKGVSAHAQCSLYDFGKCVTTGAIAKLLANVQKPPDMAEQTVTPALATYFEGVKIDIFRSLLLFI